MSYIDKNLSTDESFESYFEQHWIVYFSFKFIVSVILTFCIVGIPFLIYNILEIKKREHGLTSKRVVLKNGIIGRYTDELKLNKVETIEIHQGVIGRILSYGNVVMTGTGESFLIFESVRNPTNVKKEIDRIISLNFS